jgi:hypothetical protein
MRAVHVTPWPAPAPARAPACARPRRRPGVAHAATADAAPDALCAWLAARGLPPQQVALQEGLPGTGRGLVATQPLAAGTPLLCVPEPLLLTQARAVADAPPPLAAALAQLPEWSALATFLAAQRAALEGAGGASDWLPYVAALPSSTGGLLDWAPGEADALLAGTSHAAVAAERLAAVEAAVADVTRGAHAEVRGPPARWTRACAAPKHARCATGCGCRWRHPHAAGVGVRHAVFAPRAPAFTRRRAGAGAVG